MKPLTIEELKALQVGDWVWVESETYGKTYAVIEDSIQDGILFSAISLFGWMNYPYYGTKWIAYKNKEQAEGVYDKLRAECDDKERYTIELYSRAREAERELKDIKARIAKGEIMELPCIAMVEQGLVDGKFIPTRENQQFNGRFAVVYLDKEKYSEPLIDVCWSKESKYRYSEAKRRLEELKRREIMTDKDIETALAIHNGIKSKDDIEMCLNCPYFGNYTDCTDKLLQDVYQYVKNLKGCNKRLKNKMGINANV